MRCVIGRARPQSGRAPLHARNCTQRSQPDRISDCHARRDALTALPRKHASAALRSAHGRGIVPHAHDALFAVLPQSTTNTR
ncbi:hypothetical protein Bphy_3570 [Paraburkholderia phymatum STM815]|uniref:Uncharacterized protein n=1 Tax=Paraburkholderia phymatum (strain DSM 17167 / CIP 108236 / LMG 21445 / STM815) TaxID=391038 RepID=B2JM19_PARP8|nr:hypothetical protein Bphy_3570 [Paraburkholderia phymatum STM815]